MYNSPFIFKGNEYINAQSNPRQIADKFTNICVIFPDRQANHRYKSFLISPEINMTIEGNTTVTGIYFEVNKICIVEKYKNDLKT